MSNTIPTTLQDQGKRIPDPLLTQPITTLTQDTNIKPPTTDLFNDPTLAAKEAKRKKKKAKLKALEAKLNSLQSFNKNFSYQNEFQKYDVRPDAFNAGLLAVGGGLQSGLETYLGKGVISNTVGMAKDMAIDYYNADDKLRNQFISWGARVNDSNINEGEIQKNKDFLYDILKLGTTVVGGGMALGYLFPGLNVATAMGNLGLNYVMSKFGAGAPVPMG